MIGARRIGRDGVLRLGFERRGAATVLAASRFTLPLQVLAPVALDDAACVVSLLNPTGGVVGGDRLTIDVEVGPDSGPVLDTIRDVLADLGLPLHRLSSRAASLDEAFVAGERG